MLGSETLNAQRLQCESEGDFLGADSIYQKILRDKETLRKKQRKALEDKQSREVDTHESNFQEAFQEFNEEWDRKIEEYRQCCLNQEQELKEKHQEEFEKTQKNLEETIPVIPKHSSEFLNLQRIRDTLARNKEYKEAHEVQQKMLFLEEQEKMNWGRDRDAKIKLQLSILSKRLENELSSFKQKAMNGLDELKKQRGYEMECFVKKYQNIKKEIDIAHRVERNKFEGKHTTGSGIYKTDANLASKLVNSPSKTFAKRPTDTQEE